MADQGDSTKGSGRSRKPVIEHDPLAMGGDDSVQAEQQPAPQQKAAAPKKKTAKKKVVRKKAAPKEPVVTEEEQPMASQTEDVSSGSSFDLGESLTIMEVAEMHQRLIQLLDAGETIELSASDTENIDGAGLQLLATFIKDAKNRGIQINWGKSSDAVREAAGQVGLSVVLGLTEAE